MRRHNVMLAQPLSERKLSALRKPMLVQPKLDGMRCLATWRNGQVDLRSSEDNKIEQMPHLEADLAWLADHPSLTLDGELYFHGMAHSQIMSRTSRRVNLHEQVEDIQYYVFDLRDEANPDWEQMHRTYTLKHLLASHFSMWLRCVPTHEAWEEEDVAQLLGIFMADGYEGVIVRDPGAPYVWSSPSKRPATMLKYKPRKEDTYIVTGFNEELSVHGVPKGSLGSLCCTDEEGNEFAVGTGPILTKHGRGDLWEIRETLIGRTATVKYQEISQPGKVPRFPVLVGLE